jgi:hypothetical protein
LAVSVGHVHAGADAQALQRALLGEALFDQIEHRHLARRPLHAEAALLGQADVFDVVVHVSWSSWLIDW